MISPSDTFTIFLDELTPPDERKPDAQRPALVYRFGTAGELRRHLTKLNEAGSLYGLAYMEAIEAAANFNLVSTRNLTMPDGSPTDHLAESLTLADMKAIAWQIPVLAELSESDRKNSESPSPTPAAASAGTAGTGAAAA